MKVSIVVPVYNVAPYIEQFARSVFEQTLEDIEYVFVDDCSPDSSMDILLSVLEEYPHRKQKVKIVRHEKNMGIAVTRKDGYMKSTGEYMIYVDSDDYLEPRMLELMYAKAKEHDADMIVCDIYLYNKENCNVLKTAPKEEGENGEKIKDDIINRKRKRERTSEKKSKIKDKKLSKDNSVLNDEELNKEEKHKNN